MDNLLVVDSVSKTFADHRALNSVSINIPKSSIFGLLGPNGAGKTTTIGILTGLVNKTSGSTKVFEYDTVDNFRETRTMIGLSPQELNFDVFFTLEELLTLQAGYYNIDKKQIFLKKFILKN